MIKVGEIVQIFQQSFWYFISIQPGSSLEITARHFHILFIFQSMIAMKNMVKHIFGLILVGNS